ncbi:MAG: NAD(P)/FAD-dependent oxidoreductase [Christensenellaceae bacterium]
MSLSKKVAVIGGGPAGMMAAYTATTSGHEVTLFEQNEKLGKKLFLTGKGRCNVTNARPQGEFFQYIPTNAKFLYSAFYCFSNEDLLALLETQGVATKVERGMRVFPASDKSSDIIRALANLLKKAGVNVRYETSVEALLVEAGQVVGLKTRHGREMFERVVLATGGLSYPSTGSTGLGHKMAEQVGHTIVPMRPSLIPFTIQEQALCKRLMGLTLKNVTLTLFEKGKKRYAEQGEVLFTHFGVSGPLVLSASAHIKDDRFTETRIEIDLKPALDEKTLDARIIRDFNEAKNKQLKNALFSLFPKNLAPEIIAKANIDGEKYVNSITKEERKRLAETTKHFSLTVTGTRKIDEAIITRGGVSVKDINASTMESKKVAGLFFAGEMMDVDGYTGGYNLQIAFSTGYLAGISL